MRNLFLLVLAAHAFIAAAAAPKIKQKSNNGIWRIASTWDLNRIPANTDTVVIPSGNVVLIDDHQNLGTSKLIIMVYGTLQFSGVGKLTLDENSALFIQSGGIVDGDGSASQKLRIGDQQLSGNDLQVAAANNALLLTAASSGYDPVPPGSGFETYAVLPVTFTSFAIAAITNRVEVRWSTASEISNSRFEIERSYNALQWTKLASVAADAPAGSQYRHTDAGVPAGLVYYRIKQVDVDGRYAFTPYRSLTVGEKPTAKIWSTLHKIVIGFSNPVSGPVKVQLIAMSGKVVQEETLNQPPAQVMVDKMGRKGCYIVRITNAAGIDIIQKVFF